MKALDESAAVSSFYLRRALCSNFSTTSGDCEAHPPLACGCDREKVDAIHAYLHAHFPGCELRHFHSPSRLMRAGLLIRRTDHHLVKISQEGVSPYYAVVMSDFQEYSTEDIDACLQQWDVAATLRASRVAVVSKRGAAAL
jgi:hypothetical protein